MDDVSPAATRLRVTTVAVLLGLTSPAPACVGRPVTQARIPEPTCEFVVFNRTAAALEIRMFFSQMSTVPLGALNPGELLHHSVPCSAGTVVIRGVGIAQVGVHTGHVQAGARLVQGARVQVALHAP